MERRDRETGGNRDAPAAHGSDAGGNREELGTDQHRRVEGPPLILPGNYEKATY
jgi:hypothetical protein